jgi:hypothetical protein
MDGYISSVLHAGGCEYPEDISTIADCKEFGALFEQMFPGLYDNSLPIMYFTRTGASLTSEMQQEAHKMARQKGKDRGLSTPPKEEYSQRKLALKETQGVFGLNISGGVRSTKDKSMKIFERNARIRKCIERDYEITVKPNACVSNYVKNADGTFCVLVDGKPTGPFHHLFATSWNNNQSITGASENSFNLGFTGEDRVIALCDISDVPHLQNTPFFTLQGGLMFMPISSELGLIYRCTEGGSYPEAGTIEIPPENTMKHGEKILEELKAAGFSHKGKNPFEGVKLLGSKVLKIVKESDKPSHQRPHVPPIVTSEDIIVGTPTKATYIPWLALQMIEKFLEQLPNSSELSDLQGFKENWLKKIQKLFSHSGELCAGKKLPVPFMIYGAIEKEDIEDEKLKLFKTFKLTKSGKSYQSKLHGVSPLRRRALTYCDDSFVSESLEMLQSRCRTRSDSFVDRELSSPLNSSFDFMASTSSSKLITVEHCISSENIKCKTTIEKYTVCPITGDGCSIKSIMGSFNCAPLVLGVYN